MAEMSRGEEGKEDAERRLRDVTCLTICYIEAFGMGMYYVHMPIFV